MRIEQLGTKALLGATILIALLAACGGGSEEEEAIVEEQIPTATMIASATQRPSSTPSLTATEIPTATQSPTNTATPIPTYVELRGKVLPEKLSCRFGPGASYLYKYGILATTNIEILGRMEHGDWLLVQAIGGSNACWVKAELLEIEGEIQSLAPLDAHVALVWSPYYGILTGAEAVREGDSVTLSWHPLELIAGDDSEQVPYVVEAWLCTAGELRFTAIGAYYPEMSVSDEAGCEEGSHARVAGAEKHGYTVWAEFDWPKH